MIVRVAVLAVLLVLALSQPALAHDCSSPLDCEQTAGYNAVIAVAGGALALASGLIGNAIGGTEAPRTDETDAAARPKRRGCCVGWFTMPVAGLLALVALASAALGLFG